MGSVLLGDAGPPSKSRWQPRAGTGCDRQQTSSCHI